MKLWDSALSWINRTRQDALPVNATVDRVHRVRHRVGLAGRLADSALIGDRVGSQCAGDRPHPSARLCGAGRRNGYRRTKQTLKIALLKCVELQRSLHHICSERYSESPPRDSI